MNHCAKLQTVLLFCARVSVLYKILYSIYVCSILYFNDIPVGVIACDIKTDIMKPNLFS